MTGAMPTVLAIAVALASPAARRRGDSA